MRLIDDNALERFGQQLSNKLIKKADVNAKVDELNDKLDDHTHSAEDMSFIGDMTLLETESKDTLVNAINEIQREAGGVSNAIENYEQIINNFNNDKQLIASAVGVPLNANDELAEMANDINGLLATFKTNMMNSGVVVNNGDKFKILIDKIEGLTEGEGNKGIQYITNTVDWSVTRNDIYSEDIDVIVDDLTFKPNFVLVELTDEGGKKLIYSEYHYNTDTDVMLYAGTRDGGSGYKQIYGFIEITDNGFNIHHTASSNPISYTFSITYHIIGVGEEDTTAGRSVEIPSFITQGCWMTAPIASNPNKDFGQSTMVAIGNNIYVMGGGTKSDYYGTDNHYAYNVKTNTWVERAKLPDVRKLSVSIAVDDGIYNTGGIGNGYDGQKTTYYYDSISNSWTTKAVMPDFKYNHAFTSFDNKLFITGGSDSVDDYGDKTFIYDILTDTWTQKEDYPSNTDMHHALTMDSDRILVFTGSNFGYYYIPSTDTWTQVNYSSGTGNDRSRMVFSPKTGKAYFANASNMVSMDFSNIDQPLVEVISTYELKNGFGDVVEVNGNIYHMYGSGDNNTMVIGIL